MLRKGIVIIMILKLIKFILVDTMFVPGDITMMVSRTELILLLLLIIIMWDTII